MHRVVAALLAAVVLAGCGQGVWLSRQDAINKTHGQKGLSTVNRREAKLMTWPDFLKVSQVQANAQDAPPGKQRVWLVAVSGNLELGPQGAHEKWAIFVFNAVTGGEIGHIVGPFNQTTGEAVGEDWPPNWSSFPDSG